MTATMLIDSIKAPRSAAVLCTVAVLSATSASLLFALSSNCVRPMFSSSTMISDAESAALDPIAANTTIGARPMPLPPRQRYAILSVGTEAKYSYWLPAVALAWKIRQRFTPIILLLDDDNGRGWANHTHTRLVLDVLDEFGLASHVVALTPDPSLPDNRARLTQMSRLYASLLPFVRDHDYLLTSDVDLLPIAIGAGQYYDSVEGVAANASEAWDGDAWQRRSRILLFDLEEFQATDDQYGYRFKEWALSNIGMTARRWRSVMRLPQAVVVDSGDVPMAEAVRQITERANEDIRTMLRPVGNEWFWDQLLVSLRLATGQRDGTVVWERDVDVRRRSNRDRIDRIAWPSPGLSPAAIDTKFDSHLPRVPDTRATYTDLFAMSRWLLEHVLNGDGDGVRLADRLEHFTAEFEAALHQP